MKNIIKKIDLHVGNRDGEAYAVSADDGKFYLVIDSNTGYGERNTFKGMGDTNQTEISEAAFSALANAQAVARPETNKKYET